MNVPSILAGDSKGTSLHDGFTATERWVIAGLAVLGIVMFFFPVLNITVPIAGTQSKTGYDLLVGSSPLSHSLPAQPQVEPRPAAGTNSRSRDVDMPASFRAAPLLPFFVLAAFMGVAATLVWSFFSPGLTVLVSAVGGALGLFAIVLVRILNSDMHRFLETTLNSSQAAEAGLFASLTKLAVGSSSFSPGGGLYVLTACLAICFLLANTRLLARIEVRPLE